MVCKKNSLSILGLGDFIQCISDIFPCWIPKIGEIVLSLDRLELLYLFIYLSSEKIYKKFS